ncbi:MAG: hypothetical protein ACTSRS_20705 [Candidatus Helarchaeota archaeon]
MAEEDTKQILKKLISVLTTLSTAVQSLEEKINQSNYSLEMLARKVNEMAIKINQMDSEVEREFAKLGKIKPEMKIQEELQQIEKDLKEIPNDLLDDELQRLLKEEVEKAKKA